MGTRLHRKSSFTCWPQSPFSHRLSKMDPNALQVFNSMYHLGITAGQFEAIKEEQKHTERTGAGLVNEIGP